MILRARNNGDIVIFELEGHLDFETTQQFQDTCHGVMAKNESQRVVFNFEKLRFVGSSGINQFIRVMKEFNTFPLRPRMCKLSTEFQKIFKAYQTSRNPFLIFESEEEAVVTFSLPEPVIPKRAPKKKAAKPTEEV